MACEKRPVLYARGFLAAMQVTQTRETRGEEMQPGWVGHRGESGGIGIREIGERLQRRCPSLEASQEGSSVRKKDASRTGGWCKGRRQDFPSPNRLLWDPPS